MLIVRLCQKESKLVLRHSLLTFGMGLLPAHYMTATVTGRFAPKPVPPGTIRSKTIFRTGRFTPGLFAPFVKNEIKVF